GLADHRPVPVEPDRAEVGDLPGLERAVGDAVVEVLHPQDERRSLRAGEQPGDEGGAQVAEVQLTGWAGSEASDGHAPYAPTPHRSSMQHTPSRARSDVNDQRINRGNGAGAAVRLAAGAALVVVVAVCVTAG